MILHVDVLSQGGSRATETRDATRQTSGESGGVTDHGGVTGHHPHHAERDTPRVQVVQTVQVVHAASLTGRSHDTHRTTGRAREASGDRTGSVRRL